MLFLLQAPFELFRTLGDAARAIGNVPVVLDRMMDQLDRMASVTDSLLEGTRAITLAAEDAQRQMALSTEQLAAANRSLEQIIRVVEPLDRMGKAVSERLQRVTGWQKVPGGDS